MTSPEALREVHGLAFLGAEGDALETSRAIDALVDVELHHFFAGSGSGVLDLHGCIVGRCQAWL